MAEHTLIEWTDATWNPVTGCSVVSPGCTNCYAMKLAGGRLRHQPTRQGLTKPTKAGPVWNGEVRLNEAELLKPLGWRRGRKIFVCAHGDLFHESVPDDWIDQVFAIAALCPQHTFQVPTKRAERMRDYMGGVGLVGGRPMQISIEMLGPIVETGDAAADERLWDRQQRLYAQLGPISARWPLPNVWLGVSAEDQARADERIPHLEQTPAAVRFVSLEPLLSPIDLNRIPSPVVTPEDEGYWHSALERSDIHFCEGTPDALTGRGIVDAVDGPMMECIDWVIVGGESGPGARPMHPDWARQIRDDCARAGVAFFFKQWGEFAEFDTGSTAVEDVDSDSEEAESAWDLARKPALIALSGQQYKHPGRIPENLACRLLERVGKKAAGRLLDGVEHNAMPEVR